MTQIVVYQAVNLINGKRYIGATEKGLRQRRMKHLANASRGQPGKFYTAIRKYGPQSFHFTALCQCSSFWEALELERRWIGRLTPEYNLTDGGGGVKGFRFSPESRSKMSKAKKGKAGHPCPEWVKEKNAALRRSEKGRPVSEAKKAALRINISKAKKVRQRPVVCVNTGKIFDSVTEAAKEYGVSTGHISLYCGGVISRAGLCFSYLDEVD